MTAALTKRHPPGRAAGVGSGRWWIIPTVVGAVSLGVIIGAVLLTAPTHRGLVLGLALVAAPITIGIDWLLGTRTMLRTDPPARTDQGTLAGGAVRGEKRDGPPIAEIAVNGPGSIDMTVQVRTRPKAGNSEPDNEDRCSADAESGYLALSDGASSSVCAGDWATALTAAFTSVRPPLSGSGIRGFLRAVAHSFSTEAANTESSWWSEDALRGGAFATFLGFRVADMDGRILWEAVAVGDTVVVQLRPDAQGLRLVEGFPLESAASFEGEPNLVGSELARDGDLPAIRLASGLGHRDDRWLLLTDELAKWAFSRAEAGRPVWQHLVECDQAGFDRETTSARAAGEMANDDLTMVLVSVR